MMDIREGIYRRRDVREFTTEPVEETALRLLVDAAIQAPSAVNQQPWLFTIHYRRASEVRSSPGFKKISEDRLDFVAAVNNFWERHA